MELLEKIKLNDGTELVLIPMGTDRKESVFIVSVFVDLDYASLESVLLNKDNISKIQHLNSVGEILTTYVDCVSFKRLSKEIKGYMDGEILKDIYVIEFNTDPILAELKRTQKENTELKEQLAMLKEAVEFLLLSKLEVEVQ